MHVKGTISLFSKKPFFIQVHLKGNCTCLFTSTGHLDNVFQDDVYVSLKKDTTSFLVLFTSNLSESPLKFDRGENALIYRKENKFRNE